MGINLTIGACYNKVPGTIGIGLEKGPACDKIINTMELDKEYSESSVSKIFSFDMIEHIPTKMVLVMFKKWYNILEIDGRIEIGTLDLAGTCRQFILAGFEERKALINQFYGSQLFDSDFHKTGYTYEILRDYLERAGFVNIKKCESIYNKWCGSLIVEAFKL